LGLALQKQQRPVRVAIITSAKDVV
jgi:hypothetical protein